MIHFAEGWTTHYASTNTALPSDGLVRGRYGGKVGRELRDGVRDAKEGPKRHNHNQERRAEEPALEVLPENYRAAEPCCECVLPPQLLREAKRVLPAASAGQVRCLLPRVPLFVQILTTLMMAIMAHMGSLCSPSRFTQDDALA